jgi:hypothetical protein
LSQKAIGRIDFTNSEVLSLKHYIPGLEFDHLKRRLTNGIRLQIHCLKTNRGFEIVTQLADTHWNEFADLIATFVKRINE